MVDGERFDWRRSHSTSQFVPSWICSDSNPSPGIGHVQKMPSRQVQYRKPENTNGRLLSQLPQDWIRLSGRRRCHCARRLVCHSRAPSRLSPPRQALEGRIRGESLQHDSHDARAHDRESVRVFAGCLRNKQYVQAQSHRHLVWAVPQRVCI